MLEAQIKGKEREPWRMYVPYRSKKNLEEGASSEKVVWHGV